MGEKSLMERRHETVQAALKAIRGLRDTLGPSVELIEATKPVLAELALADGLFEDDAFPVEAGSSFTIYELSVDPDGRLGLYASAGRPGKYQPPHDHRTWSVIAGVRGAEHNEYFERTDDGRDPGRGKLERREERTLRRGEAGGLMGDAFHAIRVLDEGLSMHLHLYGYPLDRLAGRVYFERPDGGPERPFMGRPELRTAVVTPDELAAMADDGTELAVLDTRELGAHARGHVPGSCPAPASELELRAPGLLPRRDARVVVVGDTDRAAHRAAHLIRRGGYANVAVLAGGVDGWAEAGRPVHDGMHPLAKAFGEHVARRRATPMLGPSELRELTDRGRPVALVDCRPEPEYRARHVPGAAHGPGTELLARVLEMDPDPDAPVVVSCAGRTRSIIGAQTLIDAGLDRRVFALENGTMGWELAGGELDAGEPSEPTAAVSSAAERKAGELARKLARDRGGPVVSEADLARWRADGHRTTYLFDISSPASYESGHRPGFASAPGGQLLQEITAYTAIPSARIVVADSDGAQALITAHWLRLMGRDAWALPDANRGRWLARGPDRPRRLVEPGPVEIVSSGEAELELGQGQMAVVDCSPGASYRAGHIPGSVHASRPRLAEALEGMDRPRLVFTSTDGELARFAAADAAKLGHRAGWLAGGNAGWLASGRELTAADPVFLVEPDDDEWVKPYHRPEGRRQAMERYIEWELDLAHRVDPGIFALDAAGDSPEPVSPPNR